jgi:hypothetical protein
LGEGSTEKSDDEDDKDDEEEDHGPIVTTRDNMEENSTVLTCSR